MQVIRFRSLPLFCVRHLYSASSLGVDGFVAAKNRIKDQFSDIEEKFKEKMSDFAKPDSSNMVFTEDLKHMIHLTEENDRDLNLVKEMMLKFSKQNKDLRFGSFVFGPVVMRMYHHLNKPVEALEVFKLLENDGFFDQLGSYQILMDLLLRNNMYQEVLDVFEIVKRKQIKGAKYPKNAVVLALAACYKINTRESYEYAKKLWSDLTLIGHYPMRRAGTFAAALAIQQNEPHVALEILTSMKQQSYVTIRNLKISALADLGRPDDALPLLRTSSDSPMDKQTYYEEVISKMAGAVEKFGRPEITQEFQRLEKQLRSLGHITNEPLNDLLCSEITAIQQNRQGDADSQSRKPNFRRQNNYNTRPGLQDMM